MYGQDVSWS